MMIFASVLMLASQWTVTESLDPITDKNEVRAALRGDNAELVFLCARGEKPTLIYAPDGFLGGGIGRYELRDFIYRFDAEEPQRESWKYVRGYAAAYSEKRAAAFVTKMLQSQRLVVRAERYDRTVIDSTFDLTGSAAAFHETFGKCGIG